MVSNASAFAADPEAEHVVRATLAELASIEEESIVALTLVAGGRFRRLTAAPLEGTVTVKYVISRTHSSEELFRIAATLRSTSTTEAARVYRAHVQAAGLPYAVNGADVTRVAYAPSRHDGTEEEPCEELEEGEGWLRGSHRRGHCGHLLDGSYPEDVSDKNAQNLGVLVGIVAGGFLLILALCAGLTACFCYRRATKSGAPKMAEVKGAPCSIDSAKVAPSLAQGAVVDNSNSNNNDNNRIVIGHVLRESPEKDSTYV